MQFTLKYNGELRGLGVIRGVDRVWPNIDSRYVGLH